MTFRNPEVAEEPDDNSPEIVWEILVELPFSPRLTVGEIERVRSTLWDRLNDAIRECASPFLQESLEPEIIDPHGRGAESPLFPLVVGRRSFPSSTHVATMIERICAYSDLSEYAYDASGRAYELAAKVSFIRRPQLDRAG
jgi:hypothetical protein